MRLLSAADFRRVFEKPQRSADRCFTVLARTGTGQEARLGLAIAKKHVRLAVARNRIKRVVRESFRCHRQGLGCLDFVVLAKPGTVKLTSEQLHASLKAHWQRLTKDLSAPT